MSQTAEVKAAQVVERYLREILNGEDPAALDELVANHILRDKDRSLRAAFPDLRVTARQVMAAQDLVAIHASAAGTHRGLFQGVPPTGRRWSASFTGMFQVADGRIADFWVNWDVLSILEQLDGVRRTAGASA